MFNYINLKLALQLQQTDCITLDEVVPFPSPCSLMMFKNTKLNNFWLQPADLIWTVGIQDEKHNVTSILYAVHSMRCWQPIRNTQPKKHTLFLSIYIIQGIPTCSNSHWITIREKASNNTAQN